MASFTCSTGGPRAITAALVRSGGFGRWFDVICATFALLVLWPVFLVIAVLVLVFDGRPVFYRQERVGRGGRPFRIWKFRTMCPDSAGPDESLLTVAGNPRITTLGRVLRGAKLDELPQLFNVLLGEMSFIGPRPEVARYVDLGDAHWQAVLSWRPGLTDLATLAYVDEEDTLAGFNDPETCYRQVILPRKLDLNIRYAQLRTRRTDLRLILLTAGFVLHLRARDQKWMRRFLPPDEQSFAPGGSR
jgi:lipopolysaccharide/colanic/teichoic acid biosynthesis glycosyltransferase